ncbi:MAG TPA: O-antigen ligase family protein [Longimicrobium sp.]|nr:O-antigen ligase family protein [Longimicrobium sp.]
MTAATAPWPERGEIPPPLPPPAPLPPGLDPLPPGLALTQPMGRRAMPAAEAAARWTFFHTLLAVLLLTYVWRVQQMVPILGKLQLVSLASLGALGLFFVSGAPARLGAMARTRTFRLAAWTLALMLVSVVFALFPGQSARFLYQDHLKTFLLMVLLAAGANGVAHVERLCWTHVAGAVVYTLYVVTHFRMSGGRLQGLIYYDSNDLGMLLVGTLPFAVHGFRRAAGNAGRAAAGFAIAVCLMGIVKSGSRGALVGLAAVALYMLFRYTTIPRGRRFGMAAVGLVAMLVAGNRQYWEMMQSMLHPTQDYNWSGNSPEGRMEVWKRGIGYMAARPLTGVGVSGFFVAEGTLSQRAKEAALRGHGLKWSAPHNSFVQAGAELGIPGLLLFIALLAAAYRAGRLRAAGAPRDGPAPPAVLLGQAFAASMVGYAVTAFFLSQAYAAFLYTLLGLGIAFEIAVPLAAAAPAAQPAAAVPRRRGGGWDLPSPQAA